MPESRREAFAAHLTGELLEIGPGHEPFPVAPGAHVTYADKSVPGGRDETWPELVGAPRGPDADVDIDLDRDGLRPFADDSFDGVVASHVLEHLANPIAAIEEMHRVVRPGGHVALVLPDRHRTFDRVREPTALAHLLDEHRRGVSAVDDAHILGFCEAIWQQDSIHPEPVRSWHDPDALDPERYELHRRRSIHAHCWSAQEFAVLVAGSIAFGSGWQLVHHFIAEDTDPPGIEFGLLLRKSGTSGSDAAVDFLRGWALEAVKDSPARRATVAELAVAIARDLGPMPGLGAVAAQVPVEVLGRALDELDHRLAETRAHADDQRRRAADLEAEVGAMRSSRTWRAGRLILGPVSYVARIARRR